MEYTKEEIETAKELYSIWNKGIGIPDSEIFPEFLDSLLKPERKKIVAEIEYDDFAPNITLTSSNVLDCLSSKSKMTSDYNFKVTELHEVFSREEIKKMFTAHFSSDEYIEILINDYLERKSK